MRDCFASRLWALHKYKHTKNIHKHRHVPDKKVQYNSIACHDIKVKLYTHVS